MKIVRYLGGGLSIVILLSFTLGGVYGADKGAKKDCYESRIGYTNIKKMPDIKCSEVTGAVLYYSDDDDVGPFTDTVPMKDVVADPSVPVPDGDYLHEEAVVRPRTPHLKYYNLNPTQHCNMCHNGKTVPFPKDKKPRLLRMHQDIVPNSLKLQHGNGAIWCLDCHNPTDRNTLIDFRGRKISFNEPQKLCGKCHGQIYKDWRLGIHGKRIGYWTKGGKKRWWVCTECHNPHTVSARPFDQLFPEPPPVLPRGTRSAEHEKEEEMKRKGELGEKE